MRLQVPLHNAPNRPPPHRTRMPDIVANRARRASRAEYDSTSSPPSSKCAAESAQISGSSAASPRSTKNFSNTTSSCEKSSSVSAFCSTRPPKTTPRNPKSATPPEVTAPYTALPPSLYLRSSTAYPLKIFPSMSLSYESSRR